MAKIVNTVSILTATILLIKLCHSYLVKIATRIKSSINTQHYTGVTVLTSLKGIPTNTETGNTVPHVVNVINKEETALHVLHE